MSDMSDVHGGVTDEDIERFFADNPGIRPIQPLNGANPGLPVEFHAGDGRPVPPAGDGDLVIPEDLGTIPATTESTETEPATAEQAPTDTGGDGSTTTEPVPSGAATEPDESALGAGDAGFVTVGDQQIPASQVEAWLAFQQEINNDPVLQRMIVDRLTGRATEAPVAGAVAPQPGSAPTPVAVATSPLDQIAADLDLDDPSVKALYSIVQQQQQQMEMLASGLRITHDQTQAQQRAQTESLYKRAAESFRTSRDLESKDIDELSKVAARLNVLPSLLQGIDPITGSPARPDPLAAVERALEIAYMMVPEYRNRELKRVATTQRGDDRKKKALAAISGSSGSVPRSTTQAPKSEQERRAAMTSEIKQMFDGSWADAN